MSSKKYFGIGKNVFSQSIIVAAFVGFSEAYVLAEEGTATSKSSAPQRMEEVIVESSPLEQTLFESAQPVTVLSGSELTIKAKGSIGETLASEPGISSSYFGPGASRPVIRGLGGDRIRILENGIGSLDVSNTSPDHATNIEPVLTDKIEVVRGPASLLYGTSAVGGVVNIFDNRIPEELPDRPVAGNAEIRAGTVDEERTGAIGLTAPVGNFALHFDGFKSRTDDINIPGYARTVEQRNSSELEFPEPKGKLPFSATDNDAATIGGSYIFDTGFLGAAFSDFNTNYGVPNGEENISIDGERQRMDVRGKVSELDGLIESVSFKMGLVDYDHTEFQGSEPGTKFSQNGSDSRLEFNHSAIGPVKGLWGIQFQDSDFKAVGEEAFQPPTTTKIYSVFAFEELPVSEPISFQFGARYDGSALDSSGFNAGQNDNISRSFDTVSESTGLVWNPADDYALALSLAHTERAPSGQELYADGPHIATAAFEVGDSDLDRERSLGVDLTLRKKTGTVRGSIGGFYNRFWDYINLSPNGEEQDDLPVYLFEAVDADFIGFETQVAVFAIDEKGQELSFDFQPDYVRAQNRETNDPLPRIPALRMKAGVNYYDESLFRARLEVQHVFDQDRNADFETETSGYTFLNASVNKDVSVAKQNVEIFLRGTNLLNGEARDSVSFIKDVAPLPGASVMAGLRLRF